MNSRLGVSPISSSHRFATPSPHRTGVPISDRFSIMRTSAPPRAAYLAAVLPVGPAPTTRTSTWRSICFGPIPSGRMRLWGRFERKTRTPTEEEAIDADEWSGPEALTRMITGNYIVGCNTIRLRSREELSPSQLQEIHEAVRGLTGLTIVNQGPKFVTIENFVEPTRFPIDGLLRRLHYLTSRMEKLALGVISGDAKGNIEEVARMELEVDRLYWLVVRQLLLAAQNRTIAGRIGVTGPRNLLGDRVVTVALENVGDLWEELAAGVGPVLKPNRPIPREFAKTIGNLKGKLEDVIELTMTAFFANDLAKANEALDRQAALTRDIRTVAGSGSRPRRGQTNGPLRSNGLIQLVLRPLEHVAKYYGSIAQITINRALERPVRPRPSGVEAPASEPSPDRP